MTAAVLDMLQPGSSSVLLDGTVGTGGHAAAFLDAAGKSSRLVGCDLDAAALAKAADRLRPYGPRVTLLHRSYADVPALIRERWPELTVTHILLDLGMSALELEESERGFSFRRPEELLDMRFDAAADRPTAATLLRRLPEDELERIFRAYGEAPNARQLAAQIVHKRREAPVTHVRDLLLAVDAAGGPNGRRSRVHPATRVFQALRITVNDELTTLRTALPQLIDLLAPGGRIAVISFHSLEDRVVKEAFRTAARDCICPPSFPVCRCGHRRQITILTKHVRTPSPDERNNNPRSRSAKLRVAEKLTPP